MWLSGRITDGARSIIKTHLYTVFSFLAPILGPSEWAYPKQLGLSLIVRALALDVSFVHVQWF